ncbi:MAG: CrcB family protein [Dehalococcoidia bacterium]
MGLLLVATGGALGALARYGVSRAMAGTGGDFPVATLAVNLSGALALELPQRLPRRPRFVGRSVAWPSAAASSARTRRSPR